MTPVLSVIVPVFNEQQGLQALFDRLYPALDGLGSSYEIIFIDDGSHDRSVELLRDQFNKRPDRTRVIVFANNAGQHNAILAGFEYARGRYVVTLDADLQNPPEEIPKLFAALESGADYVGTIRKRRQDSLWRRWASRALNRLRESTTNIRITDQGCMLRGYARSVVDAVNRSREVNAFIPALAYIYARRPVEIEVAHEARHVGESKYSLYSLIRLNFDLMTGFSLLPLQFFTVTGILISILSPLFVAFLAVRRILFGPEAEGLFTLFGILFFLVGILLLGLGVVGEYIGRIFEQVRQRPRYVVAAIVQEASAEAREPGQEAQGANRVSSSVSPARQASTL
ncbi:MAG: glycosyltransferase [Gammaproteobacteria bacterium]